MTAASPPAELLLWDSEFFGFTVARVRAGPDGEGFSEADAWCAQQGVKVAYLLCDAGEQGAMRVAEGLGFEVVDVRCTLAVARPAFAPPAPREGPEIRESDARDVEALESIARTAHRDSRFYADGRFPLDRCDALYARWVRRDCEDPGVTTLVAVHDGAPIGYFSFRADDDGAAATIGLVGVHEAFRGKGVGNALVMTGITRALERAPSVSVVTQGRNIGAQRLYQRTGMTTSAVALWFHKWWS